MGIGGRISASFKKAYIAMLDGTVKPTNMHMGSKQVAVTYLSNTDEQVSPAFIILSAYRPYC
jgi:hypothetical protein